MIELQKPVSIQYDPWEAYMDVEEHGRLTLSNIEFTTTTLCNMRCEHCAVGYTLQTKDPDALPLELLLKRLEEIPHLRSMSITGGEPMLSRQQTKNYVVPLLKYARERGVRTQINSNLTLDMKRYEEILPYLDVLHISHNWGTIDEFIDTGFAMMERKPSREARAALFQKMIENSRFLTDSGVLVSAETMLNKRTLPYLSDIHKQITEEMGCQRHEIHPMYPSDFASAIESLTLDQIRNAVNGLLDSRNQEVWMLFGTLPFYPCSEHPEDLRLLERLYRERNVTVRNDPDGRSRLNVNIFSGEVIVTDFGDAPPLGNIQEESLVDSYRRFQESELAKELNCHCPAVKCLGPNVLVKDSYYKGVQFTERAAGITR
ncbi:radical SAM/CxCxxxxC motif protein YfkAB [Peribacillus sp. SCS-26]|uniref:radical SAM/CxCxxxxC motif protein YfkAB n=1 Tax=Paraperibacillus marinus TaxID=3115295 RepID=UPI003906AEF4